jgi:hypothetical protein
MSLRTKFVCGGGFVDRQVFGRRKVRRFSALATGWTAISAVPLWLILSGQTGPDISGLTLFCASLTVPQPVLLVLAIVYWFIEEPSSWTERVRDPEYDERNLY